MGSLAGKRQAAMTMSEAQKVPINLLSEISNGGKAFS